MKASVVLSLLGYLVVPSGAYILGRCTVAKKLHDGGLDYFEGYSLENWVCLAYFESKFNPMAIYENTQDGYIGFGLFQIRGSDWCGDHGRNRCHMSCSGPPGPGTASTPTPWRGGWMVASCSHLHGPCSAHQLHLVNEDTFLLAASVSPVDDLTTLKAPGGKGQKFASSGNARCRINQTSYSTWAKGLCFDYDYLY
uniref:Lysozyme like 4 n=1 Tax=Macaca mulatta TaxID=9544 RepID=A0A5F8A0H8_MACMU